MPAVKTRVPFTIKIAISIWLIFMVLQALAIASTLASAQINPLELSWRVTVFCGLGYQVYAASRLSRWSVLVHTLVYGSVTVRRYLRDPDWTQHYPMLGVFVDIIPWAAVALLVAVHWRKLNWSPLGLPIEKASNEPPSDVADPSRRTGPPWANALEAIKQLLRDDWDPIGMVPHLPADEYDSYGTHPVRTAAA